jgi:hypothetical protein
MQLPFDKAAYIVKGDATILEVQCLSSDNRLNQLI